MMEPSRHAQVVRRIRDIEGAMIAHRSHWMTYTSKELADMRREYAELTREQRQLEAEQV